MRRRLRQMARDERGMTLVELLVATAAGVVVVGGISVAMIVTVRGVERVSGHVEANQSARLTMTKIVDQLHSACIAYGSAPIRSDSTGTLLSFTHQSGSATALTPVLSRISLSGTTLSQSDYEYDAKASGTTPAEWKFKTSPSKTIQLQTGVSALSTSIPVFRYYGYSNGAPTLLSASPSLKEENAKKTVQVNIAFKAAPSNTVSGDASAPTAIQSTVFLRVSPAAFDTTSANEPCL